MEKLEPLGNNINIYVSSTYHFTTDTILLANFSKAKQKDKVCDLGTGCGTISLLISRDNKDTDITAIDIQKDAIELLKKSIELNNLSNITPIIGDIKNIKELCDLASFDLVICNPPYKLQGSGIVNPDKSKATINHEVDCTLDDVCFAASKLLKFSGRFCMCQRPERLTDVLETLRKYNLEPKRLRMVQQRKTKCPSLFLVEAKLGSNKGFMVTEPTLLIEDDNGNFSSEMKEIYGTYKEEHNE